LLELCVIWMTRTYLDLKKSRHEHDLIVRSVSKWEEFFLFGFYRDWHVDFNVEYYLLKMERIKEEEEEYLRKKGTIDGGGEYICR